MSKPDDEHADDNLGHREPAVMAAAHGRPVQKFERRVAVECWHGFGAATTVASANDRVGLGPTAILVVGSQTSGLQSDGGGKALSILAWRNS